MEYGIGKMSQTVLDMILAVRQGKKTIWIGKEFVVVSRKEWDSRGFLLPCGKFKCRKPNRVVFHGCEKCPDGNINIHS